MKNIFLLCLCFLLVGCCKQPQCDLVIQEVNGINGDAFDLTEMYAKYIDEWKSDVKTAFDDAESKIFVNTPKPDVIVGPDKDPNKCVCKGTGVIVHGDGHKTVCRFHGSSTYKR